MASLFSFIIFTIYIYFLYQVNFDISLKTDDIKGKFFFIFRFSGNFDKIFVIYLVFLVFLSVFYGDDNLTNFIIFILSIFNTILFLTNLNSFDYYHKSYKMILNISLSLNAWSSYLIVYTKVLFLFSFMGLIKKI